METAYGHQAAFKVRCYAKSELASLYLPGVDKRSALKTLKRWMYRNEELMQVLRRNGYRDCDKIFSPVQVKAIVAALGEP